MDAMNKRLDELRDAKYAKHIAEWPRHPEINVSHVKQAFDAGFQTAIAELMPRVERLVAALKESKDFCQDQLARANQAISTDCDKCDYQCEGCIRSIDDCESTKKKLHAALTEWREFMGEG